MGSHRYSSPAGEKFVIEREEKMSSGRVSGGVCAGAGEGGCLKMQEGLGEQVVNPGSRAEAEPQEGRILSSSLLNFGSRAILPPCGHRGTCETSPGPSVLTQGDILAPFDTCSSQCPEVQASWWATQPGTGG